MSTTRRRRQVESITYGVNGSAEVVPCADCDFWHSEVIVGTDHQGEICEVLVREWHQGDCQSLAEQSADA